MRAPRLQGRISWCVALPLLLLLPRALRIAHPRAWAEDEQYFGMAGLLERGYECFGDFMHNSVPALEHLLALGFRLFGRDLHVAEVLSALFAWMGCLALLRIGRTVSAGVGIGSAVLLATSALLFRYHVFEREVFFGPLVALAWAISPSEPVRGVRGTLAVGGLFALAMCVKFTAALPILAYLVWALLHRRPLKWILALGALSSLPCLAILGAYALRHGDEVWLQVLAFQMAKGSNAPGILDRLDHLRLVLEPVLILALGWLLAAARRPLLRGPCGFALLWIGVELLIKVGLKRTLWPHNFLPLLFPSSLLAACALERALRWVASPTRPGPRAAGAGLVVLALLVHWLFAVLVWHPPGERGAAPERVLVHGFGGVDREDLAQAVELLRERVRPDEEIVATCDWIPALADCLPLFRFWESYGVYRQLERAHAEGRLWEHLEEMRGRSFQQRLDECFVEYRLPLVVALGSGRVRFLVGGGGIALSKVLGLAAHAHRLSAPGNRFVVEEIRFR